MSTSTSVHRSLTPQQAAERLPHDEHAARRGVDAPDAEGDDRKGAA